MSRISEILETIGKKITSQPKFKDTPIYWDEIELTPNTAHFPCLLFKLNAWQPSDSCEYERILEIRIVSSTKDKRSAMVGLWDLEEQLREVLDEAILSSEFDNFELDLLGGSELAILRYAKRDPDSYKSTGTLNSSVIIVYYRLRY